jgi:tetratricopeptide (TPR) repeat protein
MTDQKDERLIQDIIAQAKGIIEGSAESALSKIISEISARKSESTISADETAVLSAVQGLVEKAVGNRAEAITKLSEARQAARNSSDPVLAKRLDAEYGLMLVENGSLEEGRDIILKACRELVFVRSFGLMLSLIDRLVRMLRMKGQFDTAIESAEDFLSMGLPVSALKEELALKALKAETIILAGRKEQGRAELDEVRNRARLHDFFEVEYQILMGLGIMQAETENFNEGIDLLAQAMDLAVKKQDTFRYASAAITMSQFYEVSGDRLRAYAVMVRAVASLRDFYGESVPGGFRSWLNVLKERWGEEEYNRIVREFIEKNGKV